MKQLAQSASARDNILHILKTQGPLSASDLAERLGVTAIAVRQHLVAMESDGLIKAEEERRPVGRPVRIWRPTRQAHARFADSHSDLAISMLNAARSAFGEEGLLQLFQERSKQLRAHYASKLPGGNAPLVERVSSLATMRSDEGYMAEVIRCEDGAVMLVENHCPICSAAETCNRICDAELDLFRSVLGEGVRVEREEHILQGARRCAYRIASAD